MALISCPECGKMISDYAKYCINCGFSLNQNNICLIDGEEYDLSKFKEKIVKIISLLVPMFIVSFKRAEDLAIAMESRGYIPGEKRSKLNILKIRFTDILWLLLFIIVITGLIVYRVI